SSLELFAASIRFIAWGIVAAYYIWPELRRWPRADALRLLLLLHAFRFVGLAFLVPGVVSPELPAAWAHPAAYGRSYCCPTRLAGLGQAQEQSGARARLGLQPVACR